MLGKVSRGCGGPCPSQALLARPANPSSGGMCQSPPCPGSIGEAFHQQQPQFQLAPSGWCFYCPELWMQSSPRHSLLPLAALGAQGAT